RAVVADQVCLVCVRPFIEESIRFGKAGLVKSFTSAIQNRKLYISLVKISKLRREAMPDVLICNNDVGGDEVAFFDLKVFVICRRDQFVFSRTFFLSMKRKYVDSKLVVLQKLFNPVKLLFITIDCWDRRVGRGPSMSGDRAVF